MLSLTRKQLHNCKGIIVWDFDRVLFDTEYFYREAKKIFKKYGVSSVVLWDTVLQIRREERPFSTARVLQILRAKRKAVPEKKIRKDLHDHLHRTKYFDKTADKVLHRLGKFGLLHIILSYGASSYLQKRVKVGCGENFKKHFIKILATRRPKHLLLKKLTRRYSAVPIFFVDDAESNIQQVKDKIPGVKTIHYLKGWTLKKAEKVIFSFLRSKRAPKGY